MIMEYVRLGASGLTVSRVALGCMSFGDASRGLNKWTLDDTNAEPIFRQAVEHLAELRAQQVEPSHDDAHKSRRGHSLARRPRADGRLALHRDAGKAAFECLAPALQLFSFAALLVAVLVGALGWSTYLAFLGAVIFGTAIPTTIGG